MCWILSTLGLISETNSQILYSESASSSGVIHEYGNGDPGCGVSFYDFNQDGLDDLSLGGIEGRGISFYQNTGGIFNKVDLNVNIPYEIKQILWVDVDNDGDKDLYVACFDGYNLLFKNKGNLVMEDITQLAGLPTEIHRGFGALFSDFNRDGWLDLYYVKRRTEADSILNENRLFLNHPNGVFTEVTDLAGVADRGRKPFCSVAIDYDNDKWPDIYINNDKQTINTLLHNNGDGTFSDVSAETHTNIQMDAMGTALGDYDNDGWLDMYVSNIPTGNVLLHNNGPDDQGIFTFTDLAPASGTTFNGVAWGTNFLDADNDGDLDLYVNSMLAGEAQINSTLYENLGDGTFRNLEGHLP
ncbi:MAG: VCBS repeat-containing protein, partial [Saprospiraceae bacterium]